MNVNIYDLARIIFIENREGLLSLSINVPVIRTNKERFFFYFELLCKGIVLLYGNNTNSVTLNNLSSDEFHEIRRIMKYSNIFVHFVRMDIDTALILDVLQSELDTERDICLRSTALLLEAPDDLELSEYKYVVRLSNDVIMITFNEQEGLVG